jgi:hypothetical protein
MTVWIHINTAKEVGDVDHLKVFTSDPMRGAMMSGYRTSSRGSCARLAASAVPT